MNEHDMSHVLYLYYTYVHVCALMYICIRHFTSQNCTHIELTYIYTYINT